MFVNLLDLNDNDPIFQNLPFVAEVLEGTPAGVSVYQVSVSLLTREAAVRLPQLVLTSQRWAAGTSLVLSALQGQVRGGQPSPQSPTIQDRTHLCQGGEPTF